MVTITPSQAKSMLVMLDQAVMKMGMVGNTLPTLQLDRMVGNTLPTLHFYR